MLVTTILPKLPSKLYFWLTQKYLAATVRLGKGGEKSINKYRIQKNGDVNANFCFLKEK